MFCCYRFSGKRRLGLSPTFPAQSRDSLEATLEAANQPGQYVIKNGSDPITYRDRVPESEGVDFIIQTARTASPENPLWLILLGPATDGAAALIKDPTIVDRVVVFWHGRTDWPTKCTNFNAKNDLLATQLLFELPTRFVLFDTGADLTMPMEESANRVGRQGSMGEFLHAIRKRSAYASQDLRQRGLLEDTLVIWGVEFGRTPMVQGGDDGRDHHNRSFTMWLAGGGVKAGYLHGETDELVFDVVKDPVHIHDLHATILHLLGFDHTKLTYRFHGRDFRLTTESITSHFRESYETQSHAFCDHPPCCSNCQCSETFRSHEYGL